MDFDKTLIRFSVWCLSLYSGNLITSILYQFIILPKLYSLYSLKNNIHIVFSMTFIDQIDNRTKHKDELNKNSRRWTHNMYKNAQLVNMIIQ